MATAALILAQAVIVFGFALWATIATVNNVRDFKGSAFVIGATISMSLLDEHPMVSTPLKSRRIKNPAWSRLAVVLIAAIQLCIATLLWTSTAIFVVGEPESARVLATLGFAGLIGLCFIFLLGGMWFAYWIRQDVLQLTHIGLLASALVAVMMMQL